MITYEYCTTREPKQPQPLPSRHHVLNTVCAPLHFLLLGEDRGQRYWTVRRLERQQAKAGLEGKRGWPDSVCSGTCTSSHNHAMYFRPLCEFCGLQAPSRLVRPTGQSPYILHPSVTWLPSQGIHIPDCLKATLFHSRLPGGSLTRTLHKRTSQGTWIPTP